MWDDATAVWFKALSQNLPVHDSRSPGQDPDPRPTAHKKQEQWSIGRDIPCQCVKTGDRRHRRIIASRQAKSNKKNRDNDRKNIRANKVAWWRHTERDLPPNRALNVRHSSRRHTKRTATSKQYYRNSALHWTRHTSHVVLHLLTNNDSHFNTEIYKKLNSFKILLRLFVLLHK